MSERALDHPDRRSVALLFAPIDHDGAAQGAGSDHFVVRGIEEHAVAAAAEAGPLPFENAERGHLPFRFPGKHGQAGVAHSVDDADFISFRVDVDRPRVEMKSASSTE